jgi:hypothetical protein
MTMSASAPDAGEPLPTSERELPSGELDLSAPQFHERQARPRLSPAQHALLDYAVAGAFFGAGTWLLSRHRSAAGLAFLNSAMVLGMSMLTDYPGGVYRRLSFQQHRGGDILQATVAGLGPILLGFPRDAEAHLFYCQAIGELGLIAATDWDEASSFPQPPADWRDAELW